MHMFRLMICILDSILLWQTAHIVAAERVHPDTCETHSITQSRKYQHNRCIRNITYGYGSMKTYHTEFSGGEVKLKSAPRSG